MPPKLKTTSLDEKVRSSAAVSRTGSSPRYSAHEAQAAFLERADHEPEVLVLAFADKQLVSDDQGAEHVRILAMRLF